MSRSRNLKRVVVFTYISTGVGQLISFSLLDPVVFKMKRRQIQDKRTMPCGNFSHFYPPFNFSLFPPFVSVNETTFLCNEYSRHIDCFCRGALVDNQQTLILLLQLGRSSLGSICFRRSCAKKLVSQRPFASAYSTYHLGYSIIDT